MQQTVLRRNESELGFALLIILIDHSLDNAHELEKAVPALTKCVSVGPSNTLRVLKWEEPCARVAQLLAESHPISLLHGFYPEEVWPLVR